MRSDELVRRLQDLDLCPVVFDLDPTTGLPCDDQQTSRAVPEMPPLTALVGFVEIVVVPMREGGARSSALPDRLYAILYPDDQDAPMVSRTMAAPRLNTPAEPSTLPWAVWSEVQTSEAEFESKIARRLASGYSAVVQVNPILILHGIYLLGNLAAKSKDK